MSFVFFWTDIFIYILIFVTLFSFLLAIQKRNVRLAWEKVFSSRLSIISTIILTAYFLIAFADSIHFKNTNAEDPSRTVVSLLDKILSPIDYKDEKTYSAPFATHLYVKEMVLLSNGNWTRVYPPLLNINPVVKNNLFTTKNHIINLIISAVSNTVLIWAVFTLMCYGIFKVGKHFNWIDFSNKISWPTFFATLLLVSVFLVLSVTLSKHYHIWGTDKVGNDVFYESLKSVRTGIVIGTLTTLVMLPFAMLLGVLAGYKGGIIDDVIQYIYTTLSSIPGVLLIAASILSMQIFMANHAELTPTLEQSADARLLILCMILGITSWTSLCRVLRGETLKLRELDFIQASIVLGASHMRILFKHILPNILHIVLISVVLDFSSLVLAEAVLSYVGVGVAPTTISWGNMINTARLELAREPVVWWPLLSAFIFMFLLVLPANLLSDAVQEAFDPRVRKIGG